MAEYPQNSRADLEIGKPAAQDRAGSTQQNGEASQYPPKIGPWYPPSWARRPPGMPWDDWVPWQPWMQGPGQAWPEYAYNVRLYVGDPETPARNAADLEMWKELTAKRVDAVARRDGRYTIFEARRNSGWSAIAQLLGYRALWTLNYPDLPIEALWLITITADTALRMLAHQNAITLWTPTDKTAAPL